MAMGFGGVTVEQSSQYALELAGGSLKPITLRRVWLVAFSGPTPPDPIRWLRRRPAFVSSETGERLVTNDECIVLFDALTDTFHASLPPAAENADIDDLAGEMLTALHRSKDGPDRARELVGITFRGGRRACRGRTGSRQLLKMLATITKPTDRVTLVALCEQALASFPSSDDVVKGMLLRTIADASEDETSSTRIARYGEALAAFRRSGETTPVAASLRAVHALDQDRQSALSIAPRKLSNHPSTSMLGYDGYLLVGLPLDVEVPIVPSPRGRRVRSKDYSIDPSLYPGLRDVRHADPNLLSTKASLSQRSDGSVMLEGLLDHELALSLGAPLEVDPANPWPAWAWCETQDFEAPSRPVRSHVGGSVQISLLPKRSGHLRVKLYFLAEGLDPCYAECSLDAKQS